MDSVKGMLFTGCDEGHLTFAQSQKFEDIFVVTKYLFNNWTDMNKTFFK